MPIVQRQFKSDYRKFISGESPTFATVLLGGAIKLYGVECLNWDGVTLELELKRDFELDIPRVVYDQMQGLITALTTDTVYNDVPTFDQVVNALTRAGVADEQDAPTVEEVAWAVTEIMLNDPEPVGYEKKKIPFNEDIRKYCKVILDQEGIIVPPTSLKWVSSGKPTSEFTEDPALYEAAWANQAASGEAVDRFVQSCINKLVEDLQILGLRVPSDKG